MTDRVVLVEMGPRDGLQNVAKPIATSAKIALIDQLSQCGFSKIEAASFVSPKWVPQMADAAQVMAGINRHKDVSYTTLTPNLQGFDAALASGADEVAIFASASEGFSQHNINCSIAESLTRLAPVLTAAKSAGIPVRGYVSCVTDCPYDGPIAPLAVADVTATLIEMGCYEVSLGDTIGAARPDTTQKMLDQVLGVVPAGSLAGHFHDTNGRALENITVSLEAGLRTFDSSVGGLGGCPYAPGAKGNVATEDVITLMETQGYETGIDLVHLLPVVAFAKSLRS